MINILLKRLCRYADNFKSESISNPAKVVEKKLSNVQKKLQNCKSEQLQYLLSMEELHLLFSLSNQKKIDKKKKIYEKLYTKHCKICRFYVAHFLFCNHYAVYYTTKKNLRHAIIYAKKAMKHARRLSKNTYNWAICNVSDLYLALSEYDLAIKQISHCSASLFSLTIHVKYAFFKRNTKHLEVIIASMEKCNFTIDIYWIVLFLHCFLCNDKKNAELIWRKYTRGKKNNSKSSFIKWYKEIALKNPNSWRWGIEVLEIYGSVVSAGYPFDELAGCLTANLHVGETNGKQIMFLKALLPIFGKDSFQDMITVQLLFRFKKFQICKQMLQCLSFNGGNIVMSIWYPHLETDIFEAMKNLICYQCHKKSQTLRCCKGCLNVYYCSKNCQKRSWKHRHQNECNRDDEISQLLNELRITIKKLKKNYNKMLKKKIGKQEN